MTQTEQHVLPLNYAGQEFVEWRAVARATALMLAIYMGAKLLAVAVQFLALGYFGRGTLPWSVMFEQLISAPVLLAAAILALIYYNGGSARSGLYWSLIIFIVIRVIALVVMLVSAVYTMRLVAPSPMGSYSIGAQFSRVFSTVAECVLPFAGIWLLTRPQVRTTH